MKPKKKTAKKMQTKKSIATKAKRPAKASALRPTFKDKARQGDVFLDRVAALPPGAVRQKPDGDRIIVALGSANGNAHWLSAKDAVRYLDGADAYLEIKRPTELHHAEHSRTQPTIVPKGVFFRSQPRELVGDGVGNVLD